MYYLLEFQTHPQESIFRVLQTLTFLYICVKITKAEKGSDFWLPFCLCEFMDTVGQITAPFISYLETEHKRCAPMTHAHTGTSALKSNKSYTKMFSCSIVLCTVSQIKQYRLNHKARTQSHISFHFKAVLANFMTYFVNFRICSISIVLFLNYRTAHVLTEEPPSHPYAF